MVDTIKINRTACISCGTCVAIAPDIFELDNKNISTVKKGAKAEKETLKSAEAACPVNAIKVTE